MKRRTSRGFTLIEVLIAIALILTLMGTMFGFLFDMLHTRSRAQELGGQQRAASALIDRLESDLTACIVGDELMGAGVQGDESRLRILTRSVLASAAESNVDDSVVFGDLQLAEYRFLPPQRRLEARRSSADGSAPADAYLALHDPRVAIPHLRFRYFDGHQWNTSFNSLEAGRLPVAVEVALWFDAWPNDELSSVTDQVEPEPDLVATRPTANRGKSFDDEAYARRADRSGADEPAPDRSRVILIPDSAGEDTEAQTP